MLIAESTPDPTDPHQSLRDLVLAYRKHKLERDAVEMKMNILASHIRPMVEAQGKYQDEVGYARIVEASFSISYDAKALDHLKDSLPELEAILEPHRRVSAKSSYLQIK